MGGRVVSVSLSGSHTFSKELAENIRLLAGLGVEGDAHCGALVKHRYRVKQDPTQPNLCQVHLIHSELFEEVAAKGFRVVAAEMGENITTFGIDLLSLPTGTLLAIGDEAVVEVTGLRSPCFQIDRYQAGLMREMIEKTAKGKVVRKAGIMGIIIAGGEVKAGDPIRIELPQQPWRDLVCV